MRRARPLRTSAWPLPRQTWALVRKNLIIACLRHSPATWFRAFVLPVIFTAFIAYARNLFVQPAKYGVGSPAPVKDLATRLHSSGKQLVFIDNGLGSEVDDLISGIERSVAGRGTVKVFGDEDALQTECKQTLRGVSHCFAAVVFVSTPKSGGRWNYTLRGDSQLGNGRVDISNHDNDVENSILPLQWAVDTAIAQAQNPGTSQPDLQEMIYTSESQSERNDDIRRRYMSAITGYISAALFLAMVGIIYQLSGFQAAERERGLSTLIEAMGGSKVARLLSYHLSYSAIYLPSWIVISFILWGGVFHRTSVAIVLVYHILAGFTIASWSIFLGAFFGRAQLSGISTTIGSIALAVIAQVLNNHNTAAFAILGLLFPPCNYVFFLITMGRWEKQVMATNLVKSPPAGNSTLPGIVLWVFLVLQLFTYPVLAYLVETKLYGTASRGHRYIDSGDMDPAHALELNGFTKIYPPSFWSRLFHRRHPKPSVTAVDHLNLSVLKGQILVLLGANGSGKTTTLEAVAGLAPVTQGSISINTSGHGGVGICPQKNVLWDDLTVREHVDIWNRIKCAGDSKSVLQELIENVDLAPKARTLSKNLSGGQKRKLQLAAMFTGGSRVCAVDEITSGLDPLSRRKIWDIILAARGDRTFVLTTHFLDEADLLADHIAIMSKGRLKAEGSAVQLKTRLGGGYRVHTPGDGPDLDGVPVSRLYDQTVYNIPTSGDAARVIASLEKEGVMDYTVAGPTIEDVFLKVAEESIIQRVATNASMPSAHRHTSQEKTPSRPLAHDDDTEENKPISLKTGQRIGIGAQAWVMLRKRCTVLKQNWFPYVATVVIPIIAGGVTMVVLKGFDKVTCASAINNRIGSITIIDLTPQFDLVFGPQSAFSQSALVELGHILLPNSSTSTATAAANMTSLSNAIHYVDSTGSFQQYIKDNYHNVTPGGVFISSSSAATYAFQGDTDSVFPALTMQNIVSNMLYNLSSIGGISTQYQEFDILIPQGQTKTLIFVVYTGLAMAAFPAFFALYPTLERVRNVRALHYSNGVRALPLWLAYTAFDFAFVVLLCSVVAIIWAAATSGWYGLGYLYLVLLLYGLASIQLVYIVSLVCKSQLAAFAFAAGGQAVFFLVYFIVYLSILTFAPPDSTDHMLQTMHYVYAAISPIASVIKSFFIGLNSFSVDCKGEQLIGNRAAMQLYGAPITYLIVQSLLLFTGLVLYEAGHLTLRLPSLRRAKPKQHGTDTDDLNFSASSLAAETARVEAAGCTDPLRVLHLTKRFGALTAVRDLTFGVPASTIFALLGPNGAGKSTTLSLLRGLFAPTAGDALLANTSVTRRLAAARAHLGVCPQFDAIDRMSVLAHLRFYARARGLRAGADLDHNVAEVVRAVGLGEFVHRMVEDLSGGNKRKLSLAIALIGNPAVLLLDEPSSGMDAAAKRVMWRSLERVKAGRAVVLTTHSMEEADALATRAGIVAGGLLALGSTRELRARWGGRVLVHLVLRGGARADTAAARAWIVDAFPGAEIEQRSFHGQVRFSVPAGPAAAGEAAAGEAAAGEAAAGEAPPGEKEADGETRVDAITEGDGREAPRPGGVRELFERLEREGPDHGAEFWSVAPATMDMVFLNIVGRAGVQEEGYAQAKREWWQRWRWWGKGR